MMADMISRQDWTYHAGAYAEPPEIDQNIEIEVLRRNGKVDGPYLPGRIEWHHQNVPSDPMFYRQSFPSPKVDGDLVPLKEEDISGILERAAREFDGGCEMIEGLILGHELTGSDALGMKGVAAWDRKKARAMRQAVTALQSLTAERDAMKERCAEIADDEIVEIYEDSPEIDTVCNQVVRRIAQNIRTVGANK